MYQGGNVALQAICGGPVCRAKKTCLSIQAGSRPVGTTMILPMVSPFMCPRGEKAVYPVIEWIFRSCCATPSAFMVIFFSAPLIGRISPCDGEGQSLSRLSGSSRPGFTQIYFLYILPGGLMVG